jgi:hypothetical protein
MRPSRRIFLRISGRILFFAFLACAAGASHAQSSGALPQKWDESVRALAENIAAAVNPARTISLEVKNMSSFGPGDVLAIRQELESDLGERGIHRLSHTSAASSADVRVEVTLSESAEKYVWVAVTHAGDSDRVAIVDVARPRDESAGKAADSLVLDRKLVWQQSGKILDFAVFQGFDAANSTLWILEPEKVSFYRSAREQWQFDRAIAITHPTPWPRGLRGTIDVIHQSVRLPGLECAVDSDSAKELKCSAVQAGKSEQALAGALPIKIEGHEGSDSLALRSMCGADSVVVATGTGDWTQPDSIQGYLERDGRAAASGDPIQIDGPVTALNWAAEGAARIVVHNLKTGNYEAYLVTATCGH